MLEELNRRVGEGIAVTLYWDSVGHRTMIRLVDDRLEIDEVFQVPAREAAEAFEHPFCYLGPSTFSRPDTLVVD